MKLISKYQGDDNISDVGSTLQQYALEIRTSK